MASGEGVPNPTTGIVLDDRYLEHRKGDGHPESPERLRAIQRRLRVSQLDQALLSVPASIEPMPYIKMVHSDAHIELSARQAYDDSICRLAVSGALSAVDAVCTGRVKNAFAAIRPPGHHAANNGEFGFCFYNNVAVAARYAQSRHNLSKVLIVDWDYHHGDGTEWAFYEDPSVLVFSTHDLLAFPRSGAPERRGSGAGLGFNINVPLGSRAGDAEIVGAFRELLVPASEDFQPDLVLISAGFDAREGDPLGRYRVTDGGFAQLTAIVMSIAARYSESRVVSLLEGGYDTEGTARAVEAHLNALLGRV